jgi:LysM repeat protein
MYAKLSFRLEFLMALIVGLIATTHKVFAAKTTNVTWFDLIVAMNTLRTSYGLPALVADPIIDAVAQLTAESMAANQMTWHIGNVSGRIQGAGYGGGSKVWATENFVSGYFDAIVQIMLIWSDASHMIPVVNKSYCNVGAGAAKAPNGMMYYVLQAAYTADKPCGDYVSVGGPTTSQSGSTTTGNRAGGMSQLIVPVKIATPDSDGKPYHVVQAGQSFWSIAIAYKITIAYLEKWNTLTRDARLQINQRLFIPSSNTAGYSTPTPVGLIQVCTPDADGKIIHVVQAYQTLSTISQAYGLKIDTLLPINGWKVNWLLQIGQKLIISRGNVTPSPTSRPLTPLEKLTPASDGKYYHIVKSGETLSWIASLYRVMVKNRMVWNSLTDASILQLKQKLLLVVTPPVTKTLDPPPASMTSTLNRVPSSTTTTYLPTQSQEVSQTAISIGPLFTPVQPPVFWFVILGLAGSGLGSVVFFLRRKP